MSVKQECKLRHLLTPGEFLSSSPCDNSYLFLGQYQALRIQASWMGESWGRGFTSLQTGPSLIRSQLTSLKGKGIFPILNVVK